MDTKTLMTAGLSLNVLSVVVLFFIPYPPADLGSAGLLELENANVLPSGKTVLQENTERKAKKKRYKVASLLGLSIMLVGFGLQLWSILITP